MRTTGDDEHKGHAKGNPSAGIAPHGIKRQVKRTDCARLDRSEANVEIEPARIRVRALPIQSGPNAE